MRALLGVSRNDRVETLATALAERDVATALGTVNAAVEAGEDPRQLNRQLVSYLRILLHQRAGGSPDADERAKELAARFELTEIAWLARTFSEIDYKIRHSSYAHLPFEVALVEGILKRPVEGAMPRAETKPSNMVEMAPRQPERNGRDEEVLSKPPTTALRDRVRGVAGRPNSATPVESASVVTEPPVATPDLRPIVQATPVSTSDGAVSVEQLVDLWPRIRLDVKAVNRRIEALLSSIDPVAVRGDEIILAAAYAFHRDRMNADEVRLVVDEAIGRLLKRPVKTVCVMRGEEPSSGGGVVAPESPRRPPERPVEAAPAASGPPEPPPVDFDDMGEAHDPNLDERRLTAAKNIFDAEEIS